ncbi:carboxypeptidase-like regulatory domain-containing protein [Myxococcus sp. RHSTA-1-4]|uniref:carboxypeptidase-like regulatory domain-containing protein n=1 Tax=Myxococcus sp. RHSTA-1-4 TaxID=2874601 RepID=UPI001CBC1E75|nr:carboxypeptidase-like regulatory domain-containing protein [Myxococcus sp. RHSTA-1-4]MBZ4420321.1 carboxypeptidase-like regulatory domain-containing protein [Myxococcus sp. RHSTA-1-4]
MKKHLVFAVVPFLALGCGEDLKDENGDGIADGVREPDSVTVVTPATPKGTVSGQVLSTRYAPLDAVTVEMTVGSSAEVLSATTDAKGNFEFANVPAGAQVLLTFTRSGYATLRASSVVPSSAGNVPINDGNASFGPVVLAALDGTVQLNLLTPSGRPAAGARATLEVGTAGKVMGLSQFNNSSVVVEAQAGADGVVTFTGVPSPLEMDRLGVNYRVIVNALDTNGDGILEAGGTVVFYSGSDLATNGTIRTLALPQAYDTGRPLEIDYANLAALRSSGASTQPLDNMLRSGESIYIAFNQPVQPGSVIVGLSNEYGLAEGLSLSKTLLQGNTVLSLTPSGNLQAGREYNLYVRAVSAVSNQTQTKTVSFVVGDPASPPAISVDSTVRFYDANNNGQLNSGEVVVVNFNQAMIQRSSSVQVFFRADLNRDANTTSIGEWVDGNRNITGFPLATFEPPYLSGSSVILADPRPDFPTAAANNYSSRFYFQYLPATPPAGGTPLTFTSGQSANLVLAFGLLPSPSTDVYESAWGVPQTATVNVSATLVGIPMPTP